LPGDLTSMPEADGSDASIPAVAEDPDWLPPEINTGVAHSARVYDYWLGGKDNFAADRTLGDAIIEAVPSTRFGARANRAFLGRAVRYLAAEAGIRQFLDIGTGIPTAGNTPGNRSVTRPCPPTVVDTAGIRAVLADQCQWVQLTSVPVAARDQSPRGCRSWSAD
jgi:S-adenosyl methyltransferase